MAAGEIFAPREAFRCGSELPACQCDVWPAFSEGRARRCGQFHLRCRVGPAHSHATGHTFQAVGKGFQISDAAFSANPPLPRFGARLLAEGRDDSCLRWQSRLCSVLSHGRNRSALLGFESSGEEASHSGLGTFPCWLSFA